MTGRPLVRLSLTVPALCLLAVAAWLLRLPTAETRIASYATSLRDRTRSQRHNVRLAAAALDGTAVAPGKEFSFNRTVGPWTRDRGYRRAPVSYTGSMALDWGGGVCQVASTLYNAALLAGLPISERHRHYWPAEYVPPGQDAAVAYSDIDLRFRNSLHSSLRISARARGESLVVCLYARDEPARVSLDRQVVSVARPATLVRTSTRRHARPRMVPGQPGYEVLVHRVREGDHERRELVSHDSYPAQSRIVWR